MGVIHNQATVIIKSGQTTSAPFYLGAKKPYALQMPAAFTGATVTFLGSFDNITYEPIYVAGAIYTETVVQGHNVDLAQPPDLAAYPYLQIVSASTEGADRTIIVLTRAMR